MSHIAVMVSLSFGDIHQGGYCVRELASEHLFDGIVRDERREKEVSRTVLCGQVRVMRMPFGQRHRPLEWRMHSFIRRKRKLADAARVRKWNRNGRQTAFTFPRCLRR